MIFLMRIASLILAMALPAAAGEYVLRPGDSLRLEVIEDASLDRTILIAPDGRIAVPLAGTLMAGGRTVPDVRAALLAGLADDFAYPPTVSLSLAALGEAGADRAPGDGQAPALSEASTISVYVLGEVARPGRLDVPQGATVLQVLALAGGFSSFAATKRIQLRRTVDATEAIYPLDYNAIEQGRSPNGSVVVAEGDTFVVPVRRLFE